ncbi:MAG: tRNA dihydrouridine synthase DusB, partial [Bacteroidetes bacterium RIFCSPHIGHO2_02_FULL_44_7]
MNIGPLQIEKPIILAPMEDVSDRAFRMICRRMGADIVFTEFTSSEALIREVPKALRKIKFSAEERPIAIQIYGGVETSMEGAAKIAQSFQPDFIDINCGCWVKNVAVRGDGAGLLRDIPKFEKIVKSVVDATKLPVTVKTRLGWDDESIVILDVARMVEQAGAQALTIHCRTRCQGYKGDANWNWLEKIKKVVSIPVFGNGDVETPDDVKRMFETGVDGVMIGRGAIHNPWIFKQAKHFLATGEYLPEITLKEKIDVCIEHLQLSMTEKGIKGGL